MTRAIVLLIALSALCLNVQGQSNDYFIHDEGWATKAYGAQEYEFESYFQQMGDTITENDTLVKLIEAYSVNGLSPVTNFFLAKSNLGKLYMYKSNSTFEMQGDSAIVDFSRTDSITKWEYFNSGAYYTGFSIASIDTVYFGTIGKKIFHIPDDCYPDEGDYIYEGVFDFYNPCFEYSTFLDCYSIFDSSYVVYHDTFLYPQIGNCVVPNLSVEELKIENKKLVRIVDLMGREAIEKPNNLFIYIYEDGSTERVFRFE